MAKEKRLGRGLEALLGRVGVEADHLETELTSTESKEKSQPTESIDITLIDPNPFQPRLEFDESEIKQLSASLQEHGLLQPIVVRKVGDRYQVIVGERRFRAAKYAGWHEVPVHFLAVDDRQMIELALTENIQRKDLNAIEKAISFANYLETYGGTHEELAKRLELDRSTITNLLRLLDLPAEIQDAVRKERLTQGHVRALLPLENEKKIEIAVRIQAEGWSVRETERYVHQLIEEKQFNDQNNRWNVIGKDGKTRPVNQQSDQIVQLEQNFRERLGGLKVKLTQMNEKGKGKLEIAFANHAEFEQVYALFCKSDKATA